jgi:hypothetical protein
MIHGQDQQPSINCLNKYYTEGLIMKHPLFNKWRNIRQVCFNPNNVDYHKDNYCYWNDSRSFYRYIESTLGLPPTLTAKLVRKDLDLGWQPGNLAYMEPKDHSNYMPNNCVWLTYRRKRQSLTRWAEQTGIPYHTLYNRYHAGWPPKFILSLEKYGNGRMPPI